jgi:nucleoside-diphosphate-sugar epimerase
MTVSLVTGGSGFTGSHLARALKERGDEVIILDIDKECPIDDVDFRCVDITNEEGVLAACQGVDVIFHVASFVQTKQINEEATWSVNLGGTENLLRAAQHHKIPRFIYVSSAGVVYEGKDIENGDESLPYASISISPYIDSKIAAEKAVLAANGQQGGATVALRPHIIFGPDDRRFIPELIEGIQSGRMSATWSMACCWPIRLF